MKRILVFLMASLALVALSTSASAQGGGSKTTTFDVVSSVGSYCGDPDAGTPVSIGDYDPLSTAITAQGSGAVLVTCVRGIPVQVGLNSGTNIGAARTAGRCTNAGERAMSDGGATPSFLCYIIEYTGSDIDSPSKAVGSGWGDSATSEWGTAVDGTGQGGTATYNMKIYAPPGQMEAKQANYSDTVTVTISY